MLQEWISEHELVIGALDNFSSREEQLNYFFLEKTWWKNKALDPKKNYPTQPIQ